MVTKKESGEFAEIWEVKRSTGNVEEEAGYRLTGQGHLEILGSGVILG